MRREIVLSRISNFAKILRTTSCGCLRVISAAAKTVSRSAERFCRRTLNPRRTKSRCSGIIRVASIDVLPLAFSPKAAILPPRQRLSRSLPPVSASPAWVCRRNLCSRRFFGFQPDSNIYLVVPRAGKTYPAWKSELEWGQVFSWMLEVGCRLLRTTHYKVYDETSDHFLVAA